MIGDDLPSLDFKVIRDPFDSCITALINKIDREQPISAEIADGTRFLLRGLVLVSENAFRTMRFFCADGPMDSKPALRYAIAAPPLARSLVDALFIVVFLLEDPDGRADWFYKSGWREQYEEYERLRSDYATDENWAYFLTMLKALIDHDKSLGNVTPEEEASPEKLIHYWPHPGQMLKHKSTSEDRISFLRYLNDWFYRQLSQETHLSWPGLSSRLGYLLSSMDDESYDRAVKHKSDVLFTSLIVMLSMASEIDGTLGYGLSERLQYVWGIIVPSSVPAKEIYSLRYEKLLAGT